MAATSDMAHALPADHNTASEPQDPTEKTKAAPPEYVDAVHTEARLSDPGSRTDSRPIASSDDATLTGDVAPGTLNMDELALTEPFPNGYHFPPKYPWKEATRQGLVASWKFVLTPLGFFITIYGLNVVAWGGMLFLLLCNASPAMCNGDCNYIDSPRRKWIEYDSQIVNALFCVTGFGLIPWRFRDLYYLLQTRVFGNQEGLRRLAGIHRGWYRLPGSQDLAVDIGPDHIPAEVPQEYIAIPATKTPDAPLTGVRAPDTAWWKLDFAIWTMVWNTLAQGALSGCMWGLNRYDRPSWTVGFLVAFACLIAAAGGLLMVFEGNKVKRIEGVPLTEQDKEKLRLDKEQGILHYNNIKDKKPKEKVQDPEANRERTGLRKVFRRNKDSEKR